MKLKKLRIVIPGLLAACVVGCSPRPLASGEIVRVTMGNKPVMRAGEPGSWGGQGFTQGRVEIHPTLIIVTEPNGTRHCAPPDWCSEIVFK